MAPISLFESLRKLYSGSPEDLPAISTSTAVALSVLYGCVYVLPFYLSKQTRPSPTLSRDAPSVIRARIRTVTLACVLSSICTYYVVLSRTQSQPLKALHLLGWWPINLWDIGRNMLLVLMLYTGPLFERGIVDGGWRNWIRGVGIRETLGGWMGWRNYVMGPVTEEILFRSCIIPVYILAHFTPRQIILYTPLYFAIAHVHHFYEYKLTHPHSAVTPALLRSLFQLGFTSLFGAFASFVYLRTASLPSVILIHSFANWGGLPKIWGSVGEQQGVTDTRVDSKQNKHPQQRRSKGGLAWTVSYYVLLVAGAIGFWKGLYPLTDSASTLVQW